MPHELLHTFVGLAGEINSSAVRLIGLPHPVFSTVAIRQPDLNSSAELAFIQVVSWLYVYYFEAGRPGLRFLMRHSELAHVIAEREERHLQDVRALRTTLQHNLVLSKERNVEIESQCGKWYSNACGYVYPQSEDEWRACAERLLADAAMTLQTLRGMLRAIEESRFRNTVLEQWRRIVLRFHDPAEFDRIAEIVAGDLGHPHLDVVALRHRHLHGWQKRIDQLDDGFEFEFEARRLVEDSILSEWSNVLPITGADVMEEFGIRPGKRVGEILRFARELYQSGEYDRESLLKKLAEEVVDN